MCGTGHASPSIWLHCILPWKARGEGQGAAPGLGPGQRAGIRLPARGPSSTPLPHQGLGWCVLGAPGLLELWRESQGGERWFLGVPEPGEKESRAGGGGVGEDGEGA